MAPFCTDIDLLHWEPNILRDASFASQTLLAGTGTLAGTSFTIDAGSLSAAHVAPNLAIVLSGAFAGTFPIVSVDTDTSLSLSVLYDQLEPDPPNAIVASPVGDATGVSFVIRTFWPQRHVVSELLASAAGIEPGSTSQTILNPKALRRACTLGTLQMIYNALTAAMTDDIASNSVRADLYERLYRRALRAVRVDIDTNGDGEPDARRDLGLLLLRRD